MSTKDPRIDAYIAKSAAFAQPILKRLRRLIHAACPAVEETIKWGFPHFMYKGILCSMAAFKQHCTFGFWHSGMRNVAGEGKAGEAMGTLGRITSLADLPADAVLKQYVKQAVKLHDSGIKPPRPAKPKKREPLQVPDDLQRALRSNKKAAATFDAFSYSCRKEYVEWITEAKREETRAKRIETAIEWMAEGKPRNWKYERK